MGLRVERVDEAIKIILFVTNSEDSKVVDYRIINMRDGKFFAIVKCEEERMAANIIRAGYKVRVSTRYNISVDRSPEERKKWRDDQAAKAIIAPMQRPVAPEEQPSYKFNQTRYNNFNPNNNYNEVNHSQLQYQPSQYQPIQYQPIQYQPSQPIQYQPTQYQPNQYQPNQYQYQPNQYQPNQYQPAQRYSPVQGNGRGVQYGYLG